jgi:glycosyltransferase involved in cell wall biosynthesis
VANGMRREHPGPLVSIVVPTCDRGNAITKTIQTLVLTDPPPFEIIVVDQSADDATQEALIPFRHTRRFRYVRMSARGSSIARNLGIDLAEGELIGLLDDDCEVPVNWVRALIEAFALDPRIGVVFGNVEPGPHDSKGGFIPAYSRHQPYLATGMHDKHHVEGMSSCMGVRRSVWQSLHGFDSMLGVGRPLQAGAEVDLTIRCLQAGYFVYETPGLTLVHTGFRDWNAGRLLIRRYWYGAGGVYGKQLKRHAPNTCRLLFRLGWRWAFGRSRVARSLGTRPHRLLRLAAFARGFATGVMAPVDRSTGHFAADDKELGDGQTAGSGHL